MSTPPRYAWFDLGRQLAVFVVGLGLIIYGTARHAFDLDAVITGFILVGIAPIDRYVGLEMTR